MAQENKKICIINLGTGNISACIGEIHGSEHIEILGIHYIPNQGMLRGQIVDMEKVVAGVKQVVQRVENKAECRVHTAWVCVSSPQLKSFNCTGRVSVANIQISPDDIVRTLTRAKQENLLDDYYVINHFMHGISVNNAEELTLDPLGMVADHIEAFYHLMMLPVNVMQNVEQVMNASNIHIDKLLISNIANSEFALLPEEREQGVCLVDIGCGTTSVSVYVEDKLIFTCCLPQGGYDVTRDIANELKINMQEAERIKTLHARLNKEDIDLTRMLNTEARNGNPEISISIRELSDIIIARYEEILLQVKHELDEADVIPMLGRGIVYTGGATQVYNFARFAARTTGLPAQLANFPKQVVTAESERKLLERYYYHTNCGALIYSQSENFARNAKSEPLENNDGFFERFFVKPYNKFIAVLNRAF